MRLHVLILVVLCLCIGQPQQVKETQGPEIALPPPALEGHMSVEEAIALRRSIRDFGDQPLTLEQVSQLLWAGQGITEGFKRAAPSAGATYPLTLYVVVGERGVEGLGQGVYAYRPDSHSLLLVKMGDVRRGVASACLGQQFIQEAPIVMVIAAEYERTTARYGERGERYVHMEAGHVGENIYLQAVALGLGTVAVGAFEDDSLKIVVGLPGNQVPLYVMPVGYPRT